MLSSVTCVAPSNSWLDWLFIDHYSDGLRAINAYFRLELTREMHKAIYKWLKMTFVFTYLFNNSLACILCIYIYIYIYIYISQQHVSAAVARLNHEVEEKLQFLFGYDHLTPFSPTNASKCQLLVCLSFPLSPYFILCSRAGLKRLDGI